MEDDNFVRCLFVFVSKFKYKNVTESHGGWHEVAVTEVERLGVALARQSGQDEDEAVRQALTRCQKVKSRREREIWNPNLEFREEKREISRSVFWFEKRTRTFANKMEKF